LKKLIISMSLLAIMMSAVACGDDVPPKGDHNAKEPALPAVTESAAAPPAPAVDTISFSSDSTEGNSTEGSADRSLEVVMQDEGGNYMYSPTEITVSRGETLELVLVSQNEFHSFTADDLDIDVEVEAGESDTLVFTFDQPGTFDFICVPHESLGMVGQIIVQ
jgi:plastocyanin